MGDGWTLELLLTAGPWISGGRLLEDKYLTTYLGALEMLLKGCTACYDLTAEFPLPMVEGLDACAQAYRDAGMRAVVAPMVAQYSFFEAIPGLLDIFLTDCARTWSASALDPATPRWQLCDSGCTSSQPTGASSPRRWRPRSRTTVPTTFCAGVRSLLGTSASACTATCRNRRCR